MLPLGRFGRRHFLFFLAWPFATPALAAPAFAAAAPVTATLGAFAKSLAKVGTANTAMASATGLSEYNPPISAEDENAVGKSYFWSATVEFSSTADGASRQSAQYCLPQLPATFPVSTENTPVMVAGYTLNPSVANRTVSYANGTLTITWP